MGADADSGPNLLLDWDEAIGSPRWIPAIIGSVIVHIFLFLFGYGIGSLETPQPRRATEIASNIHHVTPLFAPPKDLTQKAPNKDKVAKELSVEDIKPRPAPQERLPPAPAVRRFRPPIPQNPAPPEPVQQPRPEPPKIETATNQRFALPATAGTPNAPAPQIQSEEKPKLAFETPGRNGPTYEKSPGQAKIEVPKASVEQAVRDVVHGAGQSKPVVEDMPEIPQLPTAPASPGGRLELLSDPMGIDFTPYLRQVLARVRLNWFAVIPESARLGNRGVTLLQFVIDRDGQVPKLVIATPSGSQALDKAAVAGISASVPFPPLPAEYKGLAIRLQFAFKYNVK
jgi:TonB family protein